MISWRSVRLGLMQTLKMEKISMNNVFVKKAGFGGWDGESFTSYLILGTFWFHVNRRFRYPFISFKKLPF